jgi:putative ABC transport system permease protein
MNNTFFLPLKMAFRNILLSISRSIMLLLGVAGCVALLICAFGLKDTVNNSVRVETEVLFSYDISASYPLNKKEELIKYMEKNNFSYEFFESYLVNITSQEANLDIKVFYYQPSSNFTTIDTNTSNISSMMAEKLHVGEGDELKLIYGSTTIEIIIGKVIETSLTQGLFIGFPLHNNPTTSSNIWVKTNLSKNKTLKAKEAIDEITKYNSAFTMIGLKGRIDTYTSSINLIQTIMLVFSILLAVTVLFNVSLLNFNERIRDIATMKVLGFSSFRVNQSFFLEILIIVILGTTGGVFLGYPLLYLVMSINKVETLNFIYYIEPISYVISVGVIIFVTTIISLIFIFWIQRIKMIESLKSVE